MMGDLGDIFRAMKKHRQEKSVRNLKNANTEGFNQHTEFHYWMILGGHKLDYWPSKNKWMWKGKVSCGDVHQFINKRNQKGSCN